ncbi:MAG: tRNA (adenosine(37)-N6)-dimethylallyltransferase MiaA [Bryobacteraceae bacterium]|nr:tRNA (adenosine(37)-N6)-dimethylallyltransferase MiaA [Bryobacteraceae bacterium]
MTPPLEPPFPLVCLVGPTGSGKSDLAVALAREFDGEIVNCDSLQFYRGLDIGTAKLPFAEREGVPHHLLDFLAPDEVFTAGEFARRARPLLLEIATRRKLPIVCGGSGFYLRALLDGLFDGPAGDAALRERLARVEARRPGRLHVCLSKLDPVSAKRIAAQDVNKLIRAVEVCWLERRALSEVQAERGRTALTGFRFTLLGLDPPREAVYAKINQRVEKMFSDGLLDEIRALEAAGYDAQAKAFEAVGYRQALRHLSGEWDLATAIADTQQRTRNYAKRQWTWFRRDPRVTWLSGFGTDAHVRCIASGHLRNMGL